MTDALSRKKPTLIANLMAREWGLVEAFSQLSVGAIPKRTSVYVVGLIVHSHLVEQIWQATLEDSRVKLWVDDRGRVKNPNFSFSDGILQFMDRIYVPRVKELRQTILGEAHQAKYTIHPGATKMYKDLRNLCWWPGMKKDIARHVSRCDTYQRIKIEHQKPTRKLQPLDIPEWKWEHITMDFLTGLPRRPTGNDGIWVIVDRLIKSAHFLPMKVGKQVSKLA